MNYRQRQAANRQDSMSIENRPDPEWLPPVDAFIDYYNQDDWHGGHKNAHTRLMRKVLLHTIHPGDVEMEFREGETVPEIVPEQPQHEIPDSQSASKHAS